MEKEIKFSILTPLYNTNPQYLSEMIRSVVSQVYLNWELILVDASDQEHSYVEGICKFHMDFNNKIMYKRLEKNLGISGNTNEAMKIASGDYICLLDHDDYLKNNALLEMSEMIKKTDAEFLYSDEAVLLNKRCISPHFKPDFGWDTFRSYNYLCHLSCFSKKLQEQIGFFRSECDGSQDYDMFLRLAEKANKVIHIPKVLYYWRASETSMAGNTDSKPYCITAAKIALSEHLERVGLKGTVLDSSILTTYKIQYELTGKPLISILIPTCDHTDILKKCIESIEKKSTYNNYEIVLIENNSKKQETFDYYEKLKDDPRIKITYYDGDFNYAKICNFGAKATSGEYILFLNNDIEIITPDWIEQMLMFCQRDDVAAVGCMLYFPDDYIQHAGVVIGPGGVAAHAGFRDKKDEPGYLSRNTIAQNYSAVTAANMLVKKSIFNSINGFDEIFPSNFNDTDLCLRIREKGYNIIWTPYAQAYHYESISRKELPPEVTGKLNLEAINLFRDRWGKFIEQGDPYYSFGLDLEFLFNINLNRVFQ